MTELPYAESLIADHRGTSRRCPYAAESAVRASGRLRQRSADL
ncbi:hypothetical protein ACFPN0_03605 [Kitasatospora cinereorecta]